MSDEVNALASFFLQRDLANKTEKSFSLIGCAKSDKPYNSTAKQWLNNS